MLTFCIKNFGNSMIKFWKYHWSELWEREREREREIAYFCTLAPSCLILLHISMSLTISTFNHNCNLFWKVAHTTWLLRQEHYVVVNLVGSLKCIQVVHRLKSQIALNAELAMWEWGHENVTTWTSQFGNVDFTIWQRNKVNLANNQI
jgi:hypothetical protein